VVLDDTRMAALDEDSDASSEDYGEYEDRQSLTRSRQGLGIDINYVPRWTLRDGFREFFQNWFVILFVTSL
jgi:hypothetical protein